MFFFFKQKTAYEMRISDWSSDVCSSDLPAEKRPSVVERTENATATAHRERHIGTLKALTPPRESGGQFGIDMPRGIIGPTERQLPAPGSPFKIGRASCREQVCQYV